MLAELHYAQGLSVIRIVWMLNTEAVPGRMRTSEGWSPATISRLLVACVTYARPLRSTCPYGVTSYVCSGTGKP